MAVCVHEGALAVGVLHELADYELAVTVDVQAGCSNVDGYAEAADECFIFCNVVGCIKVEANCVLELASFWGDQDNPGPRARSHDRPVEVEGPVLVRDFWGRGLDFRPLGDEIGQGLGLYRRAWQET